MDDVEDDVVHKTYLRLINYEAAAIEKRDQKAIPGLVINKYVFRMLVQQLADMLERGPFEFEPESIRILQTATEDFLAVLFQRADTHRINQGMDGWVIIRALVKLPMNNCHPTDPSARP